MSDVFVSYKAEDRKRVQPLVQALQADGLSVWWDEHIGAGDAWRETIEQQLDSARCVIVIWSKRSVGPEGKFVRDEASRAQRRGSYVPVLIDAVEPPLGFGESQATSLRGWHGDPANPHYRAVLVAVQQHIGRKPRRKSRPIAVSRVDRRTALAGGAAAAIAIVGAGTWGLLKRGSAETTGSIAVLPFENLSGDPTQAYFSDGLAEELRSALSRIAQLKVVARTSSEAVRNDDAKTAAQKLGVANILTGSVRRSPQLIRVDAQLVDGHTGLERWSQTFDRPLGDVLAIQTNIAENVADALSIQLGQAGKAVLSLGGTRDPAAHDLFLKADPLRANDTAEGLRRSIASLDAAIDLDPNYAEAYARKAIALNFYVGTYAKTANETKAGFAEATAAARHAISLAPRLGAGHAALSLILKNELQFKASFDELRLAIDLPGSDIVTIRNYATFLAQIGHSGEASKAVSKMAILDPLNPGTFETQAFVQYYGHQFAPAVVNARRSLELGPGRTRVRSVLANSLLMLGRIQEAQAEYAKLPPTDVHGLMGMAAIAGRTGDSKHSDAIIGQIRSQFGDNASYQYAQVYAQRREADLAIASLRKAVEVRDPGLPNIKVDPFLDPLRGDPRLSDIIRQLDFPA